MEKFEVDKSWSDKDSKIPRFRELYEHNDFLTAYSKHTDMRMADNPKGAIGREDEWESHGKLQLEFLIQHGMKPEHCLLDVGCGPGRAARHFVPYLWDGHYTGTDISAECIKHARALAIQEGWAAKNPDFELDERGTFDTDGSVSVLRINPGWEPRYDFIWAHSVFTHLPSEQIDVMIRNAAKLLDPKGRFLFTYKCARQPQRSGLKQYQYPFTFFSDLAATHGLMAESLPMVWPASQRTGMIKRPA